MSLSGVARPTRPFAVGCNVCTLFLGSALYKSVACNQRPCSCRRKAVIYFTPKRITSVRTRRKAHPAKCKLLFRPSLVRNARLKRSVQGCSFFSCRTHRTLRLSRRRQRAIVSYLRGVSARLEHPTSGRDQQLVATGVKLLLSCYVHFCRQRFAAHRTSGGSVVMHFRRLLSRCFSNRAPRRRKLPAIGCFTRQMFLSPGCFNSVVDGRAKGATSRCVRSGMVRETGSVLLSAAGPVDRVTCDLNFRCPRRVDHVFGQLMNRDPGRCEARREN